jgi:hypothetical protein
VTPPVKLFVGTFSHDRVTKSRGKRAGTDEDYTIEYDKKAYRKCYFTDAKDQLSG